MIVEFVNVQGFSLALCETPSIIERYRNTQGMFEVPLCTEQFFRKKWDFQNEVWVEDASPEEIANHQQEQQMIQAKQFIDNNKIAGKKFYDDIHLRVTVALFAVERNILFPILQEVDTKLYPPLEKIKTGDFASALFIFTNQAPPTNEFVLNFYNEAIQYCQNYYDTKYPK